MSPLRKQTQKEKEQLEEYYHKEEEDLMQILAERNNLPYINLTGTSINGDALKLVEEERARETRVAPFSLQGKKVDIAVHSPKTDEVKQIVDELEREGYDIQLHMASDQSLEKAWKLYAEISYSEETEGGSFDISQKDIGEFMDQIDDIEGLVSLIKETDKSTTRYKTSRILEETLAGAIALGASDIHLEPTDTNVRVRFRLDGVLQDLLTFKEETYQFILSRIKLLSGLKLNVHEEAQDGRFSIKLKGAEIEIRTSILPGEYGESIVMRVLNPDTIAISFEELGIEPRLFEVLQQEIKRPNGMILTTGPTGSGKTTTLYAILRKIYEPEIKVITIEDPIEYHLEGISQTQANKEKGYTFLSGLRSALRQDPDVMMVGEIRDGETAGVAVNAALTGHLLLSTLHTNDAAGVIPRLIDLGVNPKIISSALNISLAQRLIRKLCPNCKQKDTPTEQEKQVIADTVQTIQKKRDIEIPSTEHVWRAPETPDESCEICGGIGYKGRIGVFEGILTDSAIEDIIVTENPSNREIRNAANGQGLLTMREDGILKILDGVTSMAELGRVVDLAR